MNDEFFFISMNGALRKEWLRNLYIILFSIIPLCAYPQREAYNWCIDDGVQLDFNSGSPVASALPHPMYFDGSSAISDPCGNLLFYTDGLTVWNKNHPVM